MLTLLVGIIIGLFIGWAAFKKYTAVGDKLVALWGHIVAWASAAWSKLGNKGN